MNRCLTKGKVPRFREAVPWGWMRFVLSYMRGEQLWGWFSAKPLLCADWLEADSGETCLNKQ